MWVVRWLLTSVCPDVGCEMAFLEVVLVTALVRTHKLPLITSGNHLVFQ